MGEFFYKLLFLNCKRNPLRIVNGQQITQFVSWRFRRAQNYAWMTTDREPRLFGTSRMGVVCGNERAMPKYLVGGLTNQVLTCHNQPLRKSSKVIIMIIDIFHHCDRPRSPSWCLLSWVLISDVNTVWSSKTICVSNRWSKKVSNHRTDVSLWECPIYFCGSLFFRNSTTIFVVPKPELDTVCGFVRITEV